MMHPFQNQVWSFLIHPLLKFAIFRLFHSLILLPPLLKLPYFVRYPGWVQKHPLPHYIVPWPTLQLCQKKRIRMQKSKCRCFSTIYLRHRTPSIKSAQTLVNSQLVKKKQTRWRQRQSNLGPLDSHQRWAEGCSNQLDLCLDCIYFL